MALDYLHIFQQVHIQPHLCVCSCKCVCLSDRRLSHKTCTRTHTHRVRSLFTLLLLFLLPLLLILLLPLLCPLAATDLRRLFLIRNNFPVFQPTHTRTQCSISFSCFLCCVALVVVVSMFHVCKNIAFKFVTRTHTRTWRHLHKFPLV